MKFTIETIPHQEQGYSTVGNWQRNGAGEVCVLVSDLRNDDYNFLIGLHELIEAYFTMRCGLTPEQVDQFDLNYEGDGEPGDDPRCPYRFEHFFATTIERLVAFELGVDWLKYEEAIEALLKWSNAPNATTGSGS